MKNPYANNLINQLIDFNLNDLSQFDWTIFKNTKILITGASGLIGLKILFFLICLNNKYNFNIKITILYNTNLFKFVTDYLKSYKYIKIMKINLVKEEINKKEKFDFIFHCAGYGQPVKFIKYKNETFYLNSLTIFKLKNNLKKNGSFIYFSTSEIYSGNNKTCYEDSNGMTMPDHVRSPYIESKRFGESFILNNFKNFFVFRACLNYGPGVKINDDRVINQVIMRSILEKSISVYGGFDQYRSNLYINDSIYLMMTCISLKKYGIYNLSSTERVKLGKIFSYISSISKKKLVNKSKKITQGAPSKIIISNKKILKTTGINPKVNYKKGIKETYFWYYNLLKYKKII